LTPLARSIAEVQNVNAFLVLTFVCRDDVDSRLPAGVRMHELENMS
jgi:hypothetical protein